MRTRNSTGRRALQAVSAAALTLGTAQLASAVVFPEVEPNDSKLTATPVVGMVAGDSIVGNSTSATGVGLDYFNVGTAPAAPGIYRHRLVITSPTVGHTGTLRGLSQTAAPPDTLPGQPWDGVVGAPGTAETVPQTSSTVTAPARFNQWYGFGRAERQFYRVTGAAATTGDYTATLETQAVAPTNIGTYAPGAITVNFNGQGHTTDTEVWVYDAAFNPIRGYGDDDASAALSGAPIATTSAQSWLARNYGVGTYYLAVSTFQMTNGEASPSDDSFRTGAIMDFPGSINNSSTSTTANMQFVITDSVGTTLTVPNTHAGAFDINWFQFTVVPEPATIGLLAVGLPLLFRRRRA